MVSLARLRNLIRANYVSAVLRYVTMRLVASRWMTLFHLRSRWSGRRDAVRPGFGIIQSNFWVALRCILAVSP